MKQELISIIMPVYKVDENLLHSSIKSILNQTYRNFELILIDDGSTDRCGDICDFYANLYKRVRVIHKTNGGVSSARNYGIDDSKGEFIFFVDADDTLENEILNQLYYIAKKTSADITCCSCHHVKNGIYKETFKKGENIKIVGQSEAIKYLSYNIQVFDELETTSVWGKLYKKSVIRNIYFNEDMCIAEDFVFNFLALQNSRKVSYCSQKLYQYNFVESSLMNKKVFSKKMMSSFYEVKELLIKNQNSVYYNDLLARCINIAFTIYFKIPISKKKECHEIQDFIKKYRKKVICNRLINKKVKIALILSYLGFNLERAIFHLVSYLCKYIRKNNVK